MTPGRGRLAAVLAAAPYAATLLLFLIRFEAFVRGRVFSFRDAGFFFVPWRTVTARLLSAGIFPSWNEAASAGRALAADPNAAVFWPLTPLLVGISPTALGLLNAALAVLAMVGAARWAGLSPLASGAAGAILLLAGVFQTLPLLFTSMASMAPLPIALVAAWRLARGEGLARRNVAAGALALGLSALGGEPAIAAIGGAGMLLVFAFASGNVGGSARGRARRAALLAAAGALGVALAAVQILPTAALLARAVRGRTDRAGAGALIFSTRPGRLLTLVEPRLVGDPFAESDEDYWGAGTFDVGNPYFTDVAFGLLPLLFAVAALADPRARPFAGAAAAATILSVGRFLPGGAWLFAKLSVFRYPEKWWVLATLGAAFAAAIAVDAIVRAEGRVALLKRLAIVSSLASGLLGTLALLAAIAPELLRGLLWAIGLGAGATPAGRVAALLLPRLAAGALSALLLAFAARAGAAGRASSAVLLGLAGGLFLVDAAVRVTGALPAGANDLYARPPSEVREVLAAQGSGRFYDDGADRREVAAARAARFSGFDPLRPLTGAVFGIRYAGENDIDRMTPRASFEFARSTAALPWGAEKVRRLRLAGVTVARRPRPDGGDLVEAIGASRPLFSLVPRVTFVPAGASLDAGAGTDPLANAFLEGEPRAGARDLTLPGGRLTVREERPDADLLEIESGPRGACLVVSRSFDRSWRATVDGAPAPLVPADGPFAALLLAPGPHRVTLAHRDPLFAWGALASLLALGGIALLMRRCGGDDAR